MNLHFPCPKCGNGLFAPPDCAGRSSKCRACGQPVTVPLPVAVPIVPAARLTPPAPNLRRPLPNWVWGALSAVIVVVVWLAMQPGDNARCPQCGERFHIAGLDDMTDEQTAFYSETCPRCRARYSFWDYRRAWWAWKKGD